MTNLALSVLVVDDDDVAAEGVTRALGKLALGCHVVVAVDGLDALEVLRGNSDRQIHRPFLILLDLNMPRMNGFGVAPIPWTVLDLILKRVDCAPEQGYPRGRRQPVSGWRRAARWITRVRRAQVGLRQSCLAPRT